MILKPVRARYAFRMKFNLNKRVSLKIEYTNTVLSMNTDFSSQDAMSVDVFATHYRLQNRSNTTKER
jgi:hypothetical protein